MKRLIALAIDNRVKRNFGANEVGAALQECVLVKNID